jgi:hypothetical protein
MKAIVILVVCGLVGVVAGCSTGAESVNGGTKHAAVMTSGYVKGTKPSKCQKIDVLTFSRAQQRAALHYWTRKRMDSAGGFDSSSLMHALQAQRTGSAVRSRLTELCDTGTAPSDVPPTRPHS